MSIKQAIKNLIRGRLKIGSTDGQPFDPFESNGLSAACMREFPVDSQVVGAWESLYAKTKGANAFASPTWHAGVARHFVSGGRFRLITVRRQSEMLAVLPLVVANGGYLESAGNGVSDYLDPLVTDDAAAQPEAWQAVLTLLGQLWDHSVSALILHNVPKASAARTILPAIAAQTGFTLEESTHEPVVVIELPKSFEDYWESLDGHERRESRRRLRKAETQGNAKLLTITEESAIVPALETALSFLEAHGGEKAEDVKKYVRPFLLDVGPEMIRRGLMQMRLLHVADQPIGSVFVIPSANGPLSYNAGFDPAQKQWSPGTVVSAISIREAIEAGYPLYDFLRGTEEYKYRLGAKDVPLYRLTLKRA